MCVVVGGLVRRRGKLPAAQGPWADANDEEADARGVAREEPEVCLAESDAIDERRDGQRAEAVESKEREVEDQGDDEPDSQNTSINVNQGGVAGQAECTEAEQSK